MEKREPIKLRVFTNKSNKQQTAVLPKKIFGNVSEIIFDREKRTAFFR